MIRYAKPSTLDEALALLGEARWKILAGGTDFYPALGNRPLSDNVLDINGLDELRGVSETASHVVIGARTTWTDLIRHPLPAAFDALKQAAREVGSVQIQNVASVAGNLCNASPAADGAPALLVLDAEVELRSRAGSRMLPLQDFILGNRRTAIEPGEIVTAIRIPKASIAGSSSFQKLGARRYLVISIAMAAARMVIGTDGRIERAVIAVGACSAVAQRLPELEAALVGSRPGREAEQAVAAVLFAELSPIDDVRGSADYRRGAAREIVLRALRGALGEADAEIAA
ncbi:xanthine dehydrogenase family protein subunit M [Mesorhizobium sp. YM1C-6-2]|uniref:FAD binding domain-containing protein n=1 Tax=Mesorhizobium sp. YM1C-6-2 TaxID=1827501 RepID=UPI000EF203FD|nr:xanthine dehydrogenase family protein subunit M [Mesorhizobium sp. YM1C-6-2]RLP27831.1 xanthine dehydrogenase family protein subunit M [Mesorhizobium sp. YM1C-6-2]